MTHSHLITDVEMVRSFILAGKAKFTIVSLKTGKRFTYKVNRKTDEDGNTTPWFVSVLNGPDNWENYQYIGFIPVEDPTRDWFKLIAGRKGHPGAPSFKAFDWFLTRLKHDSAVPAQSQFWHEGACAACGRALTVPSSIATGFGPHCAAKLGIEMADAHADPSPEDAAALHAHETQAENAWLVHAERPDPESQADLELHDQLHPDGYRPKTPTEQLAEKLGERPFNDPIDDLF